MSIINYTVLGCELNNLNSIVANHIDTPGIAMPKLEDTVGS